MGSTFGLDGNLCCMESEGYYHVHNSPLLDRFLSLLNTVYSLSSYIFKNKFNIILSSETLYPS